jgi:hypothetical protein
MVGVGVNSGGGTGVSVGMGDGGASVSLAPVHAPNTTPAMIIRMMILESTILLQTLECTNYTLRDIFRHALKQ